MDVRGVAFRPPWRSTKNCSCVFSISAGRPSAGRPSTIPGGLLRTAPAFLVFPPSLVVILRAQACARVAFFRIIRDVYRVCTGAGRIEPVTSQPQGVIRTVRPVGQAGCRYLVLSESGVPGPNSLCRSLGRILRRRGGHFSVSGAVALFLNLALGCQITGHGAHIFVDRVAVFDTDDGGAWSIRHFFFDFHQDGVQQ